ncbi:MAG: hypothetical protein HZB13_18105 [Acidobacteria bacterium]|nr:hypothetical protein [Acidobacteriota bacterium]
MLFRFSRTLAFLFVPLVCRAQAILVPARYELQVRVDFAEETLQGRARLLLVNSGTEPVTRASFLLYRLLTVRGVTGVKDALEFSQKVVAITDFPKQQVNQVIVSLSEPLPPGERTAVTIEYDGFLLGYAETGMRYIQDRVDPHFTMLRDDALAYPRPGLPSLAAGRQSVNWRYEYDARITVPKDMRVVNGGTLLETVVDGERATYHYKSLRPSWRMDFAIGRYQTISVGAVSVHHLPEDQAGAKGVADAVQRAINLFTSWFGPLRDPTPIAFIEIPDGWGSQTDATAILQTAAAFRDPRRYGEAYHEVSHLWNVRDSEQPSPRLNEGLATFLETLATQEFTGGRVREEKVAAILERLRGNLAKRPALRNTPLIAYGRAGMTDLSYTVGGVFFDLLHRLIGAEAFQMAVRDFYGRYAARGASTAEFLETIRQSSPVETRALVSDWILTAAWTERIHQFKDVDALLGYYRRTGGE